MPKIDDSKKLTSAVTVKLTESDFSRLQLKADERQLPLAEWSRDRLLEALNRPETSKLAILAEIVATQTITISLLFTLARDGKLPEAKVREILERARKDKYSQANDLLDEAPESGLPNRAQATGSPEQRTRLRT